MRQYLDQLMRGESLTTEEMIAATNRCFSPETTDTEISAFLTALKMKGETADEIAGLVEVIREKATLKTGYLPNVIDNCGTGGDQSNSFNISTTAAFVIAGAGVPVAKHGNRSVSSKTGSADVLEHLGVSLTFSDEQAEETLRENGIVFLFAPHVHARLAHFMKVRKELGLPTIMNLIGPLTNPVELETQLLGVYRRDMLEVLAESLNKLGRRRAIVVNGAGFMDEASLAGENHLVLLEGGKITPFTLHPDEVGLPVYDNEAIKGGTAAENAQILLDVLNGKPGPYLDTVLLNAGIGLYASGTAESIKEGVELARKSIQEGSALARLQGLVDRSKVVAETSAIKG
ncbi:anthranilate phosphoribosyltransferase [Aciduricibacillus chroicocephali]|uniref:Anthranilate phosphoribosyltransferase n=1 Tax=Aciduricibacillus chroicocephali TaxID=3054939 RepID=A0ABY9KWG6_9BACI|nr:anthranilate phosphoribosyltransferase [Bacillaceae bacterium 44XB]